MKNALIFCVYHYINVSMVTLRRTQIPLSLSNFTGTKMFGNVVETYIFKKKSEVHNSHPGKCLLMSHIPSMSFNSTRSSLSGARTASSVVLVLRSCDRSIVKPHEKTVHIKSDATQ